MLKYILILTVPFFSVISCQVKPKIEKYNITRIHVFYTPFSISFPIGSTEDDARLVSKVELTDTLRIKQIKEEILNLSSSSMLDDFYANNVYLVCDFFSKDKKVFSLIFDKNTIKINGKLYKNNTKLINSLISSKKE